jgi:uncharacterized protein (DUF1499 family)
MRNPHGESRLVNWSRRLGIACLVIAPLSVAAVRMGMSFKLGLPAFALACLLSVVAIALLIACAALPRYQHHRRKAIVGILPALPPAILLAVMLAGRGDFPPIHDITTDTNNPPEFVVAIEKRGSDSNSLEIKPEVIELQKQYYPDLASIYSEMDSSDAFSRAAEIAIELNWRIHNSDPEDGILEASYTSFWFGFVDDIVVRITPIETGTRLDLRSVSRVGVSDLGANAKRIRQFVQMFPEG